MFAWGLSSQMGGVCLGRVCLERGCLSSGVSARGVSAWGCTPTPPWTDRLLLRMVKTEFTQNSDTMEDTGFPRGLGAGRWGR